MLPNSLAQMLTMLNLNNTTFMKQHVWRALGGILSLLGYRVSCAFRSLSRHELPMKGADWLSK